MGALSIVSLSHCRSIGAAFCPRFAYVRLENLLPRLRGDWRHGQFLSADEARRLAVVADSIDGAERLVGSYATTSTCDASRFTTPYLGCARTKLSGMASGMLLMYATASACVPLVSSSRVAARVGTPSQKRLSGTNSVFASTHRPWLFIRRARRRVEEGRHAGLVDGSLDDV